MVRKGGKTSEKGETKAVHELLGCKKRVQRHLIQKEAVGSPQAGMLADPDEKKKVKLKKWWPRNGRRGQSLQ